MGGSSVSGWLPFQTLLSSEIDSSLGILMTPIPEMIPQGHSTRLETLLLTQFAPLPSIHWNQRNSIMGTKTFWEQWTKYIFLMESGDNLLEYYFCQICMMLTWWPYLIPRGLSDCEYLPCWLQGSIGSHFFIVADQNLHSEPDSFPAYKYWPFRLFVLICSTWPFTSVCLHEDSQLWFLLVLTIIPNIIMTSSTTLPRHWQDASQTPWPFLIQWTKKATCSLGIKTCWTCPMVSNCLYPILNAYSADIF